MAIGSEPGWEMSLVTAKAMIDESVKLTIDYVQLNLKWINLSTAFGVVILPEVIAENIAVHVN